MLYLIGSIVCTSWLTLAFKFLGRLKIPALQAIVFNYWACVITGLWVKGPSVIPKGIVLEAWFPWGILMGIFFFIIFNIWALTTQRFNVAVASVANKLSLVIPFVFSIYLYQEQVSPVKIIGIITALMAVILTCLPGKPTNDSRPGVRSLWLYILPLSLFLSSGLLDTLIKYVEQTYLEEHTNDSYITFSFGMAALSGSIAMIFLLTRGRQKFDWRCIPAGFLIGIPNYFSIWFLLRVLKENTGRSSQIIPINNMGIVLFSTLVAYLLLRERLSPVNWMGILFSLLAISLLAYG